MVKVNAAKLQWGKFDYCRQLFAFPLSICPLKGENGKNLAHSKNSTHCISTALMSDVPKKKTTLNEIMIGKKCVFKGHNITFTVSNGELDIDLWKISLTSQVPICTWNVATAIFAQDALGQSLSWLLKIMHLKALKISIAVHNLFWYRSGQPIRLSLYSHASCSMRLYIGTVCFKINTSISMLTCSQWQC